MSTQNLDQPTPASVYDCALRFTMPSATMPHETHMVDLDCYSLNGQCTCESFWKFEKLLQLQYTPERALAEGLVSLKVKGRPDKHPSDALRCKHIIDAYRQFSTLAARAISNAKKQAPASF
jgi:hypothetical protein